MINIFGAGISGLTICHELIKKKFKVNIFEKNNVIGGMARSVREKNNIPTEHSWRGYGPFYYNLFNLIKEIPINDLENLKGYTEEEVKKHNKFNDFWIIYKNEVYDLTNFISEHPGGEIILKSAGEDVSKIWEKYGLTYHENNKNVKDILKKNKIGYIKNNKSVFDNLSDIKLNFRLLFNDNDKIPKLSNKDLLYLIFLFSKVILSNNRKKIYFKIKLEPLIKDNLSKNGYHYLLDFITGPGYGMDKNTISLGHFVLFAEFNLMKNNRWKVMNQPTSEAWFNPWLTNLKKQGVKFYFNSELKKLNYKDNKIISCDVIIENKLNKIQGDDFIISIDPFSFREILINSKLNNLAEKYLNLNTINNQISFRLGFNKKIKFKNYNSFVLIDSPYNITFYPQELFWVNKDLGYNNKIKSLWSGTIILPYIKGNLYNKSALSLNKKMLIEEIIHQFFECNSLIKLINENNNFNITKDDIIFTEIFEDWKFNGKNLYSINKKWVNNIFNEEYRPDYITEFSNLFLSGAHCKNTINIWSMEGAVESGKNTSNIILKKYNKKLINVHKHRSYLIIEILKKIDDLIYFFKLPNITFIFMFILILFFIKFIYVRRNLFNFIK